VKDRLIRVVLGLLVLTVVVAIVYGWTLVHTVLGLTSMFYFAAFTIFIGYFMAYALGDIVMTAYDTYKKK
jgi:hypothetical protein